MTKESKEYKKKLKDQIDWKIIDQLHNATNSFSSKSIELKKSYFLLLGVIIPIGLNRGLTNLSLITSLSPVFISCFFWFLDSYTFYYQEKLRERMNNHFDKIKKRNFKKVREKNGEAIELTRTNVGRIKRSILNAHFTYSIIILINLFVVIYLKCNQ